MAEVLNPDIKRPKTAPEPPDNASGVTPSKPQFGKGQPAHYCGKPGRSGAKPGNLNGLKNGSGLSRRLVIGNLPKQLISVRNEGRSYRRALEAELMRVKGEIDLTAAHHIDTASAATVSAGIARWLLREKIGEMTTSDVLACSREITKSKQARDAAVRALGLDAKDEVPPWAVPIEVERSESTEDAQ